MPVLDVVDGVVHRPALHRLDVEVHRRIVRVQEQLESRGVGADLVEQLVERDEVARALAHGHRLTVAQERDPLVDQRLERVGVEAERLGRTLQPRDVAVMIGARARRRRWSKPRENLSMRYGAVRTEIRVLPVGPNQHPILVVAVVGRAEPHSAFVVVRLPDVAQPLHRRLDLALRRKLGFPEVHVERDPEPLERGLDPPKHPRHASARMRRNRSSIGQVGEPRHPRSRGCLGQVLDVLAVVAVGGDLRLAARELQEPSLDRGAEPVHLTARHR